MKTQINLVFAATVCSAAVAHADTTLVYELMNAQGEKIEQTYQIRGRFMRVDSNAESQPYTLILDAGYLFMNVVDREKGSYTTFGGAPFHQGERLPAKPKATGTVEPETAHNEKEVDVTSPQPSVLSPAGRKETVAGTRCMVVDEIRNDKPVAQHCLADAAALEMTSRELITMARLIEFSKQKTDPDWIAFQSDENFISIRSRPAEGEVTFVLKSVSHDTLPWSLFRVSPEYKKQEPEDDYAGLITGKK